jgi:hypothetical protein
MPVQAESYMYQIIKLMKVAVTAIGAMVSGLDEMVLPGSNRVDDGLELGRYSYLHWATHF